MTDVFQELVIVSNAVAVATMFRDSKVPTQSSPRRTANQWGNDPADDLVTLPPSASVPPVAVETRHGPLTAPTERAVGKHLRDPRGGLLP